MAFIGLSSKKTCSFLVLICCLTFSLHTSQTEACHRTDRAALLDFKSNITEDPYQLLQTWNQSTDCCIKWKGVDCDSNGRVSTLILYGRQSTYQEDTEFMVGTISPSLGKLKFLRYLELSNLKRLTGTIPQELGKLLHLTDLRLGINQLKGSIPASFRNLRKLNLLHLNNNLLSGDVPINVLQHMSSLSTLNLSGNKFSGRIPSSIDKLVSLESLDFQQNNFSGNIPSSIGFLKNLYFLILDDNMLTGKLPNSLSNLTNLRTLSARNNRLTGKIPPSLSNFTDLRELDLSRNGFSGPIPSELVKLGETLYLLDLSFNPLSLVNIPSWISKMRLLEYLRLAQTGLIGVLPEWLSSSSLVELDLSSNMLSGVLPAWIGSMPRLFYLNISNNGFHSDIPFEFKNRSFWALDLHSNNFTGGLSSIFPRDRSFADNHFIDLSYNRFVGRIDDIGSLESMEYLETLVLSNNHLEGSLPESLAKLSSLKTLKLEKNGFTGSIPSGVINIPSLREFDVSYNKWTGKIPPHTTPFPASSFKENSGLCDDPLPRCKAPYNFSVVSF
ncbi:hypothetical protein MKW92_030898 [Papaver armeniacum]|nr:hypothetical protein MKW92_030898 [Papaver armeniacum]